MSNPNARPQTPGIMAPMAPIEVAPLPAAPPFTFEEFQATGKDANLALLHDEFYDTGCDPIAGRVYMNCLWVQDASDWGMFKEDPTIGRWYTVIGNCEHQGDLEVVERHLYAFAVSEGYTLGVLATL